MKDRERKGENRCFDLRRRNREGGKDWRQNILPPFRAILLTVTLLEALMTVRLPISRRRVNFACSCIRVSSVSIVQERDPNLNRYKFRSLRISM